MQSHYRLLLQFSWFSTSEWADVFLVQHAFVQSQACIDSHIVQKTFGWATTCSKIAHLFFLKQIAMQLGYSFSWNNQKQIVKGQEVAPS